MSAIDQVLSEYAQAAKESPNVIGEILRAWAFPADGYGCYSTFELRPEFSKKEPSAREFEFLWGRKFDPDSDEDGWGSQDKEEIKNIRWFVHPNGIEVGWHWDGDGVLAFFSKELESEDCDGSVVNHDCKHDDEWSFGGKL